MNQEEIVELHAIVNGRVQGVGFRATVCYHATKMNLKGTVCNLPDGGVEIYAQGPRHLLDNLLKQIKGDFGLGLVEIDSISTEFHAPTHQYEHFSIIYGRTPKLKL